MISNYEKFFESVQEFRQYDRFISHGKFKVWDYENGKNITIDLDGQTGIIGREINRAGIALVCFDNYFTHFQNDLNILSVKRGMSLPISYMEKIPTIKKDEIPLQFSEKSKTLLSLSEYIDSPFFLYIDYIDITDKPDTISFLNKNRIDRIKMNENVWNSSLRQEMRIGAFIRLLNPYTDEKSMEKKVLLYKSAYNSIILKTSEFKVVEGEDIKYWYNENCYQEGNGPLNKSCMRKESDRLDIYADNKDKISLLILVDKDSGKLMGRALIWKVDSPDVIYMDRVYTVYPSDIIRFANYADENGWDQYDMHKYMVVKIGHDIGDPEQNPYMDTFQYFVYNGENGKYYLTNKYERDSNFIELTEA